jgi:hypothetical protein
MPDTTEKKIPGGAQQPSAGRQLAWFVFLYCAGLLATALVAYFFRTLLWSI